MAARFFNLLVALALFGGSLFSEAAVVAYSGFALGPEVADWRTKGTAKTKDIDGDNIYGSSMGSVNWLHGYTGLQSSGSSTFGWAAIGYGTFLGDANYRSIDDIATAPANVAASITTDYFTFQLTGTNADYAGRTVRVGIMSDVLDSAEWAMDRYKGYRLLQDGGTGDSGIVPIRGGLGGDTFGEMYFFDITGAKAGDQFQIVALKNLGGISFFDAYVGPVSFDIVPEPSAILLLALGAAVAAGRRRCGTGPRPTGL